MKRTSLCNLLRIDFPIVQAGMGSFTSPELVAAVSNAGALGSLGAASYTPSVFEAKITRIHELTSKPFAINFALRGLDEEKYSIALKAKPALLSFSLGEPGNRISRAHDAGIPVMLQCTSARHAREAVKMGVDIIIAQGGESGGFAGTVSTMALVPQVVDIAGSIPVVAAGGIADGRGLAAALMLGAQGVNVGTRFLASEEAPISTAWKQSIVAAESEEAFKFEVWNDIMSSAGDKFLTSPRVLNSPFVKEWGNNREGARRESKRLQTEIMTSIQQEKWGDLFPFAGQSVGLINEILPAGEIVRQMVAGAEKSLKAYVNNVD